MNSPLEQFVPSSVCMSCDGCCRFKEGDSRWRPKLGQGESQAAFKNDLLAKIYSKETMDGDGSLKTTSCRDKNHHCCTFLDQKTNACRIYEHRPFECKLYPFVLTKRRTKVVLTVHHLCPYIQDNHQTPEFKNYAAYLKTYFLKKETQEFIRQNPSLAGEYPGFDDELEYLFDVL